MSPVVAAANFSIRMQKLVQKNFVRSLSDTAVTGRQANSANLLCCRAKTNSGLTAFKNGRVICPGVACAAVTVIRNDDYRFVAR